MFIFINSNYKKRIEKKGKNMEKKDLKTKIEITTNK